MPQPAFSVSPASCTLFRMSSIESWMVPDTVQLIVEVAGLCSSAPAFDMMRPGRDRALAQRPQETLVQRLALRGLLDVGQRPRDARERVVHGRVDRGAVLGGQPVFPVPDVERRFLERNFFDVFVLDPDRCAHFFGNAPLVPAASRIRRRNLTRACARRRRLTAISRGSLTSSAGRFRPSAGDHKILCQGCEIISARRCCQGFPYGKNLVNKVYYFSICY